MNGPQRALANTLSLLARPFIFQPTPSASVHRILADSLNQLPEDIAEQIASSNAACSECGFRGHVAVISTRTQCQCGGKLRGKLPQLRIIRTSQVQVSKGYEVGAIILGGGTCITADDTGSVFTLQDGSATRVLESQTLSQLIRILTDSFFINQYGGVQYIIYYQRQILYPSHSILAAYEFLPESVAPAMEVTNDQLVQRQDTCVLNNSAVLHSDDDCDEKHHLIQVFGNDSLISMDCNVPSLVVFALFFIISLGLLIHMCLLFSMIGDQSTLVVDDLIVDTSLLVHMNGVQSAIQFHSQQQPQLSIITESIQTDIAQSNTATVDTEFSSSNFALATKTLQTARTSFIVVNNGRLAATEISSAQFTTGSSTSLTLTNAKFSHLTAFQTANIGALTVKSFTFTGSCAIQDQIDSLECIDITTYALHSENLVTTILSAPALQTSSLTLSDGITVPNLVFSQVVQTQGIFTTRALQLGTSLSFIGANTLTGDLVVSGATSLTSLNSSTGVFTHSTIGSLTTDDLGGGITIYKSANIANLEVKSLRCTDLILAGQPAITDQALQLGIIAVSGDTVVVGSTNSTTVVAPRIVQR
ncbi:hypothetical protein SS50377_23086 [Spironucleus salmonicida]|uniref:Uncharacterized protein n=1 Tax=Spironucleus salmonicida TaxID=348837 RepID=A0A9P8LWA2_9EUKA|nr:hypothetical protein SS50377_23086 [Spironucleus salmonicida]